MAYAAPHVEVAHRPLSVAAVASLVFGVLICIPFVTGLCAVIVGIFGVRDTGKAGKNGRVFAVCGTVLGGINILIWAGFLAFIISASQVPRAVLHGFAAHVVAGDMLAAASDCDGTISTSDLDSLHSTMATWGSFSGLTCTSIKLQSTAGGEVCELSGIAGFSTGRHTFHAEIMKDSTGDWKVHTFRID